MPVCPQCDNRVFATKEALLQHMRSSSAWHPFCTSCDRRFVSEAAYNAHLEAKHPRTFDCTLCNRVYHAQFALEDHYRGSSAHPNCYQCGRGFLNHAACEEHRRTEHQPPTLEAPAPILENTPVGVSVSPAPFSNDNSITPSPGPSSGSQSTHAVENNRSLLESDPTNHSPYSSTGFTPLSPKNPIQALIVGERRIHTPDLRDIGYSSPLTQVQPLTPTSLPPPGAGFEEIWGRKENRQYESPQKRNSSPSLYYTAPALRSPPLFQSHNPGSSFARPAGPQLQIPPAPRAEFDPRLYPGSLRAGTIHNGNGTVARVPQSHRFSLGSIPTVGGLGSNSNGGAPTLSSPPFMPTSRNGLAMRRPFFPEGQRPYSEGSITGSGQSTTGRSDRGSISSLNETLGGLPTNNTTTIISRALMPESHRLFDNRFGSGGRDDVGEPSSAYASSIPSFSPVVNTGNRASLFAETLSDSGTPNNLPILPYSPRPLTELRRSPPRAAATVSSPASSIANPSPVSGHPEPSTRPTTVSPSHLRPNFQLTITPNSECPSPVRSPTVDSPFGLARLPSISPLATTPLDLLNWDIPEAAQPLPDSPAESTPDALDPSRAPSPIPVDVGNLTPIEPSPVGETSGISAALASTPIPDTPILETSPIPETSILESSPTHGIAVLETSVSAEALAFELSPIADTTSATADLFKTPEDSPLDLSPPNLEAGALACVPSPQKTPIALSPVSPVASFLPPKKASPDIAHDESEPTTPVAPSPKTPTNPLHCRACLADSCDDITASMCGHIFCNRCIVDAVIKTNRCPVCMTPTLLYCLFRLDL